MWNAADNPFPAYAPRLSRSEERALKKQRTETSNDAMPVAAKDNRGAYPDERRRIAHFVMNLPDSAITFLDAFRGLLVASEHPACNLMDIYERMPMVHCHCFTREMEREGAERDIRQARRLFIQSCNTTDRTLQRVYEQLGRALHEENEVSLHLVRSVAPNKDMYCISFRLPRDVALDTSHLS